MFSVLAVAAVVRPYAKRHPRDDTNLGKRHAISLILNQRLHCHSNKYWSARQLTKHRCRLGIELNLWRKTHSITENIDNNFGWNTYLNELDDRMCWSSLGSDWSSNRNWCSQRIFHKETTSQVCSGEKVDIIYESITMKYWLTDEIC